MHGYIFFSSLLQVKKTVNSYAWVHFVVFYAYYWRKHGKYLCMGTFSGFLCILMVKTR